MVIRAIFFALGVAAFAAGIVMQSALLPVRIELCLFGAVLIAGVGFERMRYKAKSSAGGTWTATGEKFVDPESGVLTEVYYNETTGERTYRPV